MCAGWRAGRQHAGNPVHTAQRVHAPRRVGEGRECARGGARGAAKGASKSDRRPSSIGGAAPRLSRTPRESPGCSCRRSIRSAVSRLCGEVAVRGKRGGGAGNGTQQRRRPREGGKRWSARPAACHARARACPRTQGRAVRAPLKRQPRWRGRVPDPKTREGRDRGCESSFGFRLTLRSNFLSSLWDSSTPPAPPSSATCRAAQSATPGGRPTRAAWTSRRRRCEFFRGGGWGGAAGVHARLALALARALSCGCLLVMWSPRARETTGARRLTHAHHLHPPSHSKRQWAIPTKVPGFWKTPASEARYETAHDPALKTLRRRNIDEE